MKQKIFQITIMLAAVGISALALVQNQNPAQQDTSRGNAAPMSRSALRILTPSSGQVLSDTFVTVHFELVQPNPGGGDDNFLIQLDAHDPVKTTEPEYTFTGMNPGQHVLTVTEVDANGSPMPDARAEIQFSVNPAEGPAPAQSGGKSVPAKSGSQVRQFIERPGGV
jgi:hypothetical protein